MKNNGILYLFGCRLPTEGIYTSDFKHGVEQDLLNVYDIAYSRTTSEKCYVQHRLKEYSEFVSQVIEKGFVFICGDTMMAREVEAIMETISHTKGILKMKNENRLLLDVWG